MPGVDRSALSKAFTRALAPDPEDRFASCTAFCDAMHGAIVPELPMLGDVDDFAAEEEGELPAAASAAPIVAMTGVDDLPIAESFHPEVDDTVLTQERETDLDPIDRPLAATEAVAVPSWNPAAAAPPRRMDSPRFGPIALFFAVIVGAVFGFAAGYMAKPRALQSSEAQQFARDQETTAPVAKASETPEPTAPQPPETKGTEAPQAPVEAPAKAAVKAPAKAPEDVGRLLVRSTPSGASVSVDGVARGVTPLALRDLDFGTRTVVVARSGYVAETLRVSISAARPSRALDVRLASVRPRDTTPRPAALGKPAVATGTLAVDSRPTGASVTINGKASGVTPLTLDAVAPGEYRITMVKPGYQTFSTTVRVVAGERVRAAYSLTALEQQ